MSGFTVFAIVVVVLAIVGLALRKNGEMSGLGRAAQAGSRSKMRAPHGRLVRTKLLDDAAAVPFSRRLLRALGASCAVTLILIVLCLVGLLDMGSALPASLDVLFVLGICMGVSAEQAVPWRSLGYAFVGYAELAAAATLVALYAVPGVTTAIANGVTVVAGTLGSAFLSASAPMQLGYAREFEDGHVDALRVADRSSAARAFDELVDPSWKPPADRIKIPDVRTRRCDGGSS